MAGKYITVPGNKTYSGKPERRYQTADGEIRLTGPLETFNVRDLLNLGAFNDPRYHGWEQAEPTTQPKASSGLTEKQQKALIESTEGANARVARIKAESDALVDAARTNPEHQYHQLFKSQDSLPVITTSDDVNARDSAYQAMKQQYAPQADIWGTDEGKAILAAAQSNQYGGEAAGLADYYSNQQKAGIGAMPEIIDAMGYTGDMAKWAEANPALAMREYNKKFANSYEGTGPDNAAIQQAMGQGKYFPSEGSPNPLGETGVATDMNMAQFAETQPVAMQATGNTPFFTDSTGIPGLGGKDLYNKYALMLGNK